MLDKYSIRTQIIGAFIVMTTIALLVVSSIALNNINTLGVDTQNLTYQALEDEVRNNTLSSSRDIKNVIERKLDRAISVINALHEGINDLFNNDFEFLESTSYFDYNSSTMPEDSSFDSNYQTNISTSSSTFYYPNSYPENLTDGSISTQMWEIINISSHVDSLFRKLLEENPDFAWLYVGFQEEGLFRIFPGSQVSSTREYDPRDRTWYIGAVAEQGSTFITEPYLDAFGQGWMISISRLIYKGNGDILGVVSGDLTLETMQNIVTSVQILETGYAAMIQTDGQVLAHPEWNEETANHIENIQDIERNQDDGSPALTNELLTQVSFGKEGLIDYIRDDVDYLLAFTSALNKYKIIVVVEKEKAFESVNGIEDRIEDSINQVRTWTIVISVTTFVAILLIGLYLSNQIISPIEKLNSMAMKITMNITSKDLFEGVDIDESLSQDDELGDLTRSFTRMLRNLRDNQK
ncbi:MAG: HAMP domain-containing protein [Candidatus Heimdallarchaeota archaeon]|nr:HAMP domain-containing protein [Candidatus Heimdallarchaeota archaeon]